MKANAPKQFQSTMGELKRKIGERKLFQGRQLQCICSGTDFKNSNRKFKILGKRDYAKFGFRTRLFIVYCDLILKFKSKKYRLLFKI